ncbi:MAG: hypothetical protein WBP81_08420 [Solirubrobacteraceae bacterium]
MGEVVEDDQFAVDDPAGQRVGEARRGHQVVSAERHQRRHLDLTEYRPASCASTASVCDKKASSG